MSKWEKVKLGKYALIAAGQSAPQGESCYSQEGRPFIKAGNLYGLTNGTKEDDILKVNEDIAKKYKLKMFPKDTIVFAKSGMSCLKGYIYIIQDDCYVVNHLACVLPNIKYLYPSYIKYFFIYSPVNKLIKDEAYPSIRLTDIGEIKIPLPPLDIQKKIAAALDTANALIEKRKEQIEKLDLLIKSQFIEMFGDPVTNPKGWEIKRLGALTNKITDGVHQKPIYTTYGVPFISVANINKGVLNFDDCKFVSEEDYLKMTKSVKPEQGDILYTKVGATYGIPAFIDTDKRFCLYVSVCLIKPISELINARFLAISMSMPYIKRQADERIRGIGVPDLHLNQISEFNICVPKRVEQEEFVQFVEQVETQKALLKKSLADMEQNYQSLLQKCFKGEIF